MKRNNSDHENFKRKFVYAIDVIVIEYSLNGGGKKPFEYYTFRHTVAKMTNIFNGGGLLVYLNWKILHAHGIIELWNALENIIVKYFKHVL